MLNSVILVSAFLVAFRDESEGVTDTNSPPQYVDTDHSEKGLFGALWDAGVSIDL
jgi:hypothetical protein